VTRLAELVRVSNQVAATASRLAKIRSLADFLRPLEREEIEIALPYLSGDIRQGKLAVGYAPFNLRALAPPLLQRSRCAKSTPRSRS
jgi:DNA ligase 1